MQNRILRVRVHDLPSGVGLGITSNEGSKPRANLIDSSRRIIGSPVSMGVHQDASRSLVCRALDHRDM